MKFEIFFSASRQEEIPTVSGGVPNTTGPITSEPWSTHAALTQITISGAKDMRPGYNDRKCYPLSMKFNCDKVTLNMRHVLH